MAGIEYRHKPTPKDMVHGPVCPKCKIRTGRPKVIFVPTFECPKCKTIICFRMVKNGKRT